MKYNIILHTTTKCNYKCSYCDVIKNVGGLDFGNLKFIVDFIKNNKENIKSFKFFGGEPLLEFSSLRYIIDKSFKFIGNKFYIVTNNSILNEKIGLYFYEYFEKVFFSVDSENDFELIKILKFIDCYNIKNKVYFNLVFFPGQEEKISKVFFELYKNGIRNFNILPVYYTKDWSKDNLLKFSKSLKNILDISLKDKTLNFYGFNLDNGYNSSLINESIFINIDFKVYYSDIISTYIGSKYKKDLYIGDLENINLQDLDFNNYKTKFLKIDEKLTRNKKGLIELHKIMDYFSVYLKK